jgi:hypothetical protein
MWGLGFEVWGLGFEVEVWDLGLGEWGLRFGVWRFGLGNGVGCLACKAFLRGTVDWIVFVIVKQYLVKIGREDGPTEY